MTSIPPLALTGKSLNICNKSPNTITICYNLRESFNLTNGLTKKKLFIKKQDLKTLKKPDEICEFTRSLVVYAITGKNPQKFSKYSTKLPNPKTILTSYPNKKSEINL